MENGKTQGKQQKSQASRSRRVAFGESARSRGYTDLAGNQRARKGSAADGTNSTGPRKTE